MTWRRPYWVASSFAALMGMRLGMGRSFVRRECTVASPADVVAVLSRRRGAREHVAAALAARRGDRPTPPVLVPVSAALVAGALCVFVALVGAEARGRFVAKGARTCAWVLNVKHGPRPPAPSRSPSHACSPQRTR